MVATANGKGYRFVASDDGVFSFGGSSVLGPGPHGREQEQFSSEPVSCEQKSSVRKQ
jgi:hypothetical protein